MKYNLKGLTPKLWKYCFPTDHPENRTFGLGTERKVPGAGREREEPEVRCEVR